MPNQHHDATRAALERIAQDGSDLNRPLKMDFFVAIPNERGGRIMAARAAELGFETSVEQDAETGDWTCYCTKILVPTYEAVVAIESQLDSLARNMGGHADGFGTFGNADLANDER
ncbi:ribonuclease E inhibitor RraB [Paraliomyxa miuraensis]|uniref:ribonuclease E inhibitor RraB n=1 Tax=Paraliomyxa miuraensis TaxID=376150 RepID=UPI00225AFF4F|nr:ribonuclease E inhibitor RraB [Paraliomyxa miuraensis]MCX4248130.1 ribonuclease E inhibitor RraB [Paraliomyxa miuraensis]